MTHPLLFAQNCLKKSVLSKVVRPLLPELNTAGAK